MVDLKTKMVLESILNLLLDNPYYPCTIYTVYVKCKLIF